MKYSSHISKTISLWHHKHLINCIANSFMLSNFYKNLMKLDQVICLYTETFIEAQNKDK